MGQGLFGSRDLLGRLPQSCRRTHVVHTGGNHRADSGIHLGRGQHKSAAAANAQNGDFLPVHKGLKSQEIHSCPEVFGE